MPNGVICGGAVEGSNQLGAMVTCHAMTARPDGAGAAALAVAPRATTATSSKRPNARRKRRPWNGFMSTLRAAMVVWLERSGEDGLRLLRRQPLVLLGLTQNPRQRLPQRCWGIRHHGATPPSHVAVGANEHSAGIVNSIGHRPLPIEVLNPAVPDG